MKLYYGYVMIDGRIVVNEEEKKKIQKIYRMYLNGLSISKAGQEAGIPGHHPTFGRILSNPVYLGAEDYPRIIEEELFNQVQEKRAIRKNLLGRDFKAKEQKLEIPTSFHWGPLKEVPEDVYARASVLFESIEVSP